MKKEMITENSKVKTLVEKNGYPVGAVGVVVSIYTSGPACEVEVWDADWKKVSYAGYTSISTII